MKDERRDAQTEADFARAYHLNDDDRDINLGYGHIGIRYGWHPDRDLNPQYADRPDIGWLGLTIEHPLGPGPCHELHRATYDDKRRHCRHCCTGGVMFDIPGAEHFPGAKWQVVSWDPLTISPSVLCMVCGDHGFIRDGLWVPA